MSDVVRIPDLPIKRTTPEVINIPDLPIKGRTTPQVITIPDLPMRSRTISEGIQIADLPTVRHRARPSPVPKQVVPAVEQVLGVSEQVFQLEETPEDVAPSSERAEQAAFSPPLPAAVPDYQVGYGHPPKHSQFQKGVSGNKKGRPKGSKNASTIARQMLDRKAAVTIDGKRQKLTALEIGLLQQVKRATEKGDLKSLQYVTSLAEGNSFAGSASPSAGLRRPEPGLPEAIDPQDLAILVYHQREQMLSQGILPDVVDTVLAALGLVAKGPTS